MLSIQRLLLVSATLLALAGCATIDFDYPREETTAYAETGETFYGRALTDLIASKPEGQSGFYPLPDGIESLAARLVMASNAERSIDLQYYLIKTDITGTALINALVSAADRGVRVRLLLDDFFAKGYDFGMAGLDSHPNIEIRIYNPFYRGAAGRVVSGLTNFGRINRRMHNKSFTVDNQVTVIGGRNIADEYFGAREDAKFGDMDVLGIGPVVNDVSTMFDSYWNHPTALPLPAFANMPDDSAAELERVRQELQSSREEILASVYAGAVRDRAFELEKMTAEALTWAPYQLVYDSPDKGIKGKSEDAARITTPLSESFGRATDRVIVISPYFVPRRSGVESITQLRQRGIDVTIITNSLAANNQFTVHGGYAPSRKPLLESGVRLYEVRPDADVAGAEFVAASGAKSTLHTKAFIIDERELFIGSFNFDPRSANINTESGVIIFSPEMAKLFAETLDGALERQTYELFLNDRGKLRWRSTRDGENEILEKEPQTTWGQRFAARFVSLLPIRSQL